MERDGRWTYVLSQHGSRYAEFRPFVRHGKDLVTESRPRVCRQFRLTIDVARPFAAFPKDRKRVFLAGLEDVPGMLQAGIPEIRAG
jgi:hypothetical protein